VADGKWFTLVGVEFRGEEIAEVSHFFVKVDNFEKFGDFKSVEAVDGFFLFFFGLKKELFLCKLFFEDFLFHGRHPWPLDTLDWLRDYKIGFGGSGRSEYVTDTFLDHMLTNGILDFKFEFMIFGYIDVLLLFAGFSDKIKKMVGLLVPLDFVQLVRDGFTVVDWVKDHLMV
jgi:hypothetical protein